MKVAVIGAGVSGLATARELKSEGHQVVVYEKSSQIGGTWLYTPETESEEDPLGIDPNRKIIHSSLYASLRSNLPRQLMCFPDYPWKIEKDGLLNNFPGHEEVLQFLNEFANEFGLGQLIRFNVEVVGVEKKDDGGWAVEWRSGGGSRSEEMFEAVVVCNGHYTQPKLADLPGIQKWPGKQIHSHNYRVPEPYRDQVVVVIGSGPSAYDICEDISKVAKEVHLSSRWPDLLPSKVDMFDNVWQHTQIEDFHENGEVTFGDGASIGADIVLHCTGYKYDFPFLRTKAAVIVDNNRVGPLYKHIFPPELAPGLSFVGLTNRAPVFLMIYLQAKWVAHVLSGKAILASKEEMLADVRQHYHLMEQNGVPKNHTHILASNMREYLEWLASQVGLPLPVEMVETYDVYVQALFVKGLWSRFREEYINNMTL